MSLSKASGRWNVRTSAGKKVAASRRGGPRPGVEPLEGRIALTGFTAANIADLVADINAANAAGGSNTITMAAGATFTLSAVDNTTDGATGLPVIAANDNLTLVGNGDVLQRSTASGTPSFRLLDVAAGASLSLQSLTLQGGISADTAQGGGILSNGSLSLSSVSVLNNQAIGSSTAGFGGGIYSAGSLVVQGGSIQNNQALGPLVPFGIGIGGEAGGGLFIAAGTASMSGVTIASNTARGGDGPAGVYGGYGLGGGVYIADATVTLNNVSLLSNPAQGGKGGKAASLGGNKKTGSGGKGGGHVGPGNGGNGLGGGLYMRAGTLSLVNTTVSNNAAIGGQAGGPKAITGAGIGGGLYLVSSATVTLDAFTKAHTINNTATTSDPDISGAYTVV